MAADVSRHGQADLATVAGYDAAAFLRVLAFGKALSVALT